MCGCAASSTIKGGGSNSGDGAPKCACTIGAWHCCKDPGGGGGGGSISVVL